MRPIDRLDELGRVEMGNAPVQRHGVHPLRHHVREVVGDGRLGSAELVGEVVDGRRRVLLCVLHRREVIGDRELGEEAWLGDVPLHAQPGADHHLGGDAVDGHRLVLLCMLHRREVIGDRELGEEA